ncbi:MAG: spore germination protein [Limnochordaceae bacterium]|nr:spore germination protein [Limnochordaceae bacterium]
MNYSLSRRFRPQAPKQRTPGPHSASPVSTVTPGPNIRPGAPAEGTPPIYSLLDQAAQAPLLPRAEQNLEQLKVMLGNTADLTTRILHSPVLSDQVAALAWIDGLVDSELQSENIIGPLLAGNPTAKKGPPQPLLAVLHQRLISGADVSAGRTWQEVLTGVLTGKTVIFVDRASAAVLVDTRRAPQRDPQEPEVEAVIRGSRDGFTEDLRTNTALIRLHLQSPALRFEEIRLGRQSQIPVNIAYIAGIAHPQLVQEVRARLLRIAPRFSFNVGSGPIEQLIEDHPFSVFPTIHHSERPDKICAQLAEGRVAIVVQGTPVVLTAPTLFWEFLQSPDDYCERPFLASFVRFLRLTMLVASLTLPSIYVALISFHQELVPTVLAIRIAGGRESVPFPALSEAMMMELSFEVLREAGLRIPRPLGQAISIVGILVIGQAAVSAGIVSPIMVVVVALTAVASFVSPSYSVAISLRLLRFPLLITAGIAGLYGIAWVLFALVIHLASLRSFGVPYLSPVVPFIGENWQDTLIRAPIWMTRRRPFLYTRGSTRVAPQLSPRPPVS